MLTHLLVKDYILIDFLDLDVRDGFSAITGETGAGKSVLIGAINLILGGRADSRAILPGAAKSVIEAEFVLSGSEGLEASFAENDIDYGELCILRREVTARGSRAFVNDTPVSLSLLKQIGSHLVDIHSQHHNMLIGDAAYQLEVLDTLAGNGPLLEEYGAAYRSYLAAVRSLRQTRAEIDERKREEEFVRFQARQLTEANLRVGEYELLTSKLSAARHAEEIREALGAVSSLGEERGGEPAVTEVVGDALRMLTRISGHLPRAEELRERLESLKIELEDIVSSAADIEEDIELDADEKEALERRSDEIQTLLFKYRLSDVDELIRLRDDFTRKLEELDVSDERLADLARKAEEREKAAAALAGKLHERRETAAGELDAPLHRLMKELGIAGAAFRVDFARSKSLTPGGLDEVRFLFATNKNSLLQPIREVASGGEISRFMLALKTILAKKATLPTVIFDEIDTGVSGETAEKVGRVMQEMSARLQVLAITHLPQIAAIADIQLLVFKRETAEGFRTEIKPLETDEERVDRIAAMLSGSEQTEAARANARDLLAAGRRKG